MAAKFKEEKGFPLQGVDLFPLAEQALLSCGFAIQFKSEGQGLIQAKSNWTIWSFGENINVIVTDGTVRMESECALPTQIIDWGKNKKNSRRFFDKLSALSGEDEFV